ncbi:hypothetical protein, partial [Parazoarcus communis]
GGNNRATALSLNACPYLATSFFRYRPRVSDSIEATTILTQRGTDEEREKLMREQMQDNLFSEAEAEVERQVKDLRKVPFDFYYRYVCETSEGEKERKHKIVDWEVGAFFWNCRRSHGADWEVPFRAKLEKQLGVRDLMFLMGNQHRFQDQWLIISLIYPPKQKPVEARQGSLF